MAGLFDALNNARSGINASRAGVELTGHNITNAGTEGYHRRSLVTSPAVMPYTQSGLPPIIGAGVEVLGSERAFDTFLNNRVTSGLGQQAYASTQESYFACVEQSVGDLSENGLSAVIGDLFGKFSALSAAPEDLNRRAAVVSAGERVASTFQRVAQELGTIHDGLADEVVARVADVNTMTAKVAALNQQIVAAEANGQQAGDLRDRRDQLISELGTTAGVYSFMADNGQATVMMGSQTLVQGNYAATLSATKGTVTTVELQSGSISLDVSDRFTSGTIGGLLSVDRTVVNELGAGLDQLATDLANQINSAHQGGYDLDGNAGQAFFAVPAGPTGVAASMSVSSSLNARTVAAASSTTSAPGDGSNAAAIADLLNQRVATGGNTFVGAAGNLAMRGGALAQQATQNANLRKDELTHLKTLQQSSDGVSLDEEMIQLVQFQRSYQANVKVLNVVDNLIERLVTM